MQKYQKYTIAFWKLKVDVKEKTQHLIPILILLLQLVLMNSTLKFYNHTNSTITILTLWWTQISRYQRKRFLNTAIKMEICLKLKIQALQRGYRLEIGNNKIL